MGGIHDGWTADQVRAVERPLIEAGIPLMRRAATGLAAELRRELEAHSVEGGPGEVILLAGSGDNGGDGLFAVAELAAEGVPIRVVATGRSLHAEGLAAARSAGARLDLDVDPTVLADSVTPGAVIVDAMVGIGTSGSVGLRGRAAEISRALGPALARAAVRVVAVDVPSGIGVDDGALPEDPDAAVLPADVTVTFGETKAGLLRGAATGVAGEVRLVDLGLGDHLIGLEPAVRARP